MSCDERDWLSYLVFFLCFSGFFFFASAIASRLLPPKPFHSRAPVRSGASSCCSSCTPPPGIARSKERADRWFVLKLSLRSIASRTILFLLEKDKRQKKKPLISLFFYKDREKASGR